MAFTDLLCGIGEDNGFLVPTDCFNLDDVDVCDVVATLPRQYRSSPNICKILEVFTDTINCIYSDLRSISGVVNCSDLSDAALTRYGELVGFPRCHCGIYCFEDGVHCIENDELYCKFIQAHLASKGNTTIGNLERVIRILFGEDAFIIESRGGSTKVSAGRALTDEELYYIELYKRFLPHSCATTVEIYDIEKSDLSNIFGINCGTCTNFGDACSGAETLCNPLSCLDLLHPPVAPSPFTDTGDTNTPINVTHGTFTDEDGDNITLTSDGLPVSITFTDNGDGTYTLSGNFPPSSGTDIYTVTADDGNGGVVVLTGNQIITTGVLLPPNISCPPNQILEVGDTV